MRVAGDLLDHDSDLGDDGVYGYALARQGIYSFRGLVDPSEQKLTTRINEEQQKPRGSQGARAFARDLRRTLLLLGFLEKEGEVTFQLSAAATRILALGDQITPESRQLWTNALLSMELREGEEPSPFHPTQAMLRIAAARPGVEKRWLAFTLDMQNDSQDELDRILELVDSNDFDGACASLSVTEYEAANAVKIIPALMEQVGILAIDQGRSEITAPGQAILDGRATTVLEAPAQGRRYSRRRARDGRLINGPEDILIPVDAEHADARTADEQLHSALKLEERTREHQELVRVVVSQLQNVRSVRCSDDAFDALAETADGTTVLLLEMKTLRRDALIQARVGVGQLLYYEFFDVRSHLGDKHVVKVLLFNDEPGEEVRAFLEHCSILCVAVLSGKLTTIPQSLREFFRT